MKANNTVLEGGLLDSVSVYVWVSFMCIHSFNLSLEVFTVTNAQTMLNSNNLLTVSIKLIR